jgi:hypothetical protein
LKRLNLAILSLLLCFGLTACPFDTSEPLNFVVSSSRASINRIGCDQGLQASIVTDEGLSAESTSLPEGGYWDVELGQFSVDESVFITVEAYCYRENASTGFIKVEGNILVREFQQISVTAPFSDSETSCLADPNGEYQIEVVESAAPLPYIQAYWQPSN